MAGQQSPLLLLREDEPLHHIIKLLQSQLGMEHCNFIWVWEQPTCHREREREWRKMGVTLLKQHCWSIDWNGYLSEFVLHLAQKKLWFSKEIPYCEKPPTSILFLDKVFLKEFNEFKVLFCHFSPFKTGAGGDCSGQSLDVLKLFFVFFFTFGIKCGFIFSTSLQQPVMEVPKSTKCNVILFHLSAESRKM